MVGSEAETRYHYSNPRNDSWLLPQTYATAYSPQRSTTATAAVSSLKVHPALVVGGGDHRYGAAWQLFNLPMNLRVKALNLCLMSHVPF